jgi:uncharacterized protein (DUF2249 family)
MISRHTTLGRLLDEHPVLVDVLAGYHARFAQLRDPQTRKVMAPRVTVAQAASMAGVEPEALLDVICRALGEPGPGPEEEGAPPAVAREPKPAALGAVPAEAIVHLDVRDDIKNGAEPFGRIMGAVKALGDDQVLVLRVPFEPFPLYQILGQRGFAHWTECRAADDWSAWFYRQAADAEPRGGAAPAPAGARDPRRTVIDVRGLEPPQPMVVVLEEADRLGPGERLEVLHDRRPVFLYPQLDERGLEHQTDESEPGVVRIVIRRKAGGPR